MNYKLIGKNDEGLATQVAIWYEQQWGISTEKTIEKLKVMASDPLQFHLVLEIDHEPVATAGVYRNVAIQELDPSLNDIHFWLALVYTCKQQRNKGYASLLCAHLEKVAKQRGIKTLYLFTHTAENLYQSLNWELKKRINHGKKNIAVMQKQL